jgi:hypothetical protein
VMIDFITNLADLPAGFVDVFHLFQFSDTTADFGNVL